MKCFLVWIVVFLQTLSIYAQTPIEAFLNQKPGADAVNTMAKAYLHLGLYEDAEELLHKAYIKAGHLYDPNISYYTISAEAKLLAAFLCEDSAIDDRDQLLLKRLQRLQDGVTIAKEGQDFLEKNREGVSADAYTRHRTSILLVLGRLYMSTGDEAYRTSKPSIAAASTIQANPSAMLEYRRAAQAFYEARMISDNQEALFLATQLGNRLEWIEKGCFFGGLRFFEMDPFLEGEDWMVRPALQRNIADLNTIYQEWRKEISNAREIADKFRREFLDAQIREKARQTEKIAHLKERIDNLRIQSETLKEEEKKYALERLEQERRKIVQDNAYRLQLSQYLEQLQGNRSLQADKVSKLLTELKEKTSFQDAKSLPGITQDKIATFNASLGKAEAILRKINMTNAATRIAAWKISPKKAEEIVQISRSVELAAQKILEKKNEFQKIESDLRGHLENLRQMEFKEVQEKMKAEINRRKADFDKIAITEVDRLNRLKKDLARSIENNIQEKITKAQEQCEKVQKRVQDLTNFLEKVQNNAQKIQEVMAMARTTIAMAADIPSGIITGTATGFINNRPQSLMEVAKMGADLAKFAQEAIITYQNIREKIEEVKGKVEGYKQKIQELRGGVIKQKIEDQIQKEYDSFKQTRAIFDAYVSEKEAELTGIAGQILGAEKKAKEFTQKSIHAHVEQVKAQVEQAKIEYEIIIGKRDRVQEQAKDLLLLLEDATIELARIDSKIEGVEKELNSLPVAASVPVPADPSPALNQILAQIEELEKQIEDEMANPAIPEHLSIAEIAGMARFDSLLDRISRYRLCLEDANRMLFKYANWLYYISSDPVCMDLAIFCQSPKEIELTKRDLDEKYTMVMKQFFTSLPKLLAIRIPLSHTKKQNFMISMLSQKMLSESDMRSLEREVNIPGLNTKITVTECLNPESDMPWFFPSYLCRNHHGGILWDVWVIPTWKDRYDYVVEIEPIGPTVYRIGQKTIEVPFECRDRNGDKISPDHNSRERKGEAIQSQISKAPSHSVLFSPSLGCNYWMYMGRGMDNVWRIKIPENSLEQLEDMIVVFAYLTPAHIPHGSTGQSSASLVKPKIKKQLNETKKQNDLERLQEEYQENVGYFGSDYIYSPAGRYNRLLRLQKGLTLLRKGEIPEKDHLPCLLPSPEENAFSLEQVGPIVEDMIKKQMLSKEDSQKAMEDTKDLYGSQTALGLMYQEWLKIMEHFEKDLDASVEELKKNAETLSKVATILNEKVNLAESINKESRIFQDQERETGLLEEALKLVQTPLISAEDLDKLVRMVEWVKNNVSLEAEVKKYLQQNEESLKKAMSKWFSVWQKELLEGKG